MDEVASLASKLDKSVATLVVSQDDRTRRFIGELLLTAAAYYLLKRYVDKYLEGLGYFEAMTKEHGQRTREFMQRLRQGTADQQSIEELKQDLEAALVMGRSKPASEAAKEAARAM